MRCVFSVVLILTAVPFVRADAGFPNFGPRPQPAQHFAVFDGLDKYPDHSFFLTPTGLKVAPGATVQIASSARLIAVPKAVAKQSETWSPEWNKAGTPGVLRSPVIHEFPRRIVSYHTTVTTHFQVELSGDELKCTRGKEDVVVPPDDRPSAWAVVGGVCGGLVLALVIVAGGLIFLVRMAMRGRKSANGPAGAKPEAES